MPKSAYVHQSEDGAKLYVHSVGMPDHGIKEEAAHFGVPLPQVDRSLCIDREEAAFELAAEKRRAEAAEAESEFVKIALKLGPDAWLSFDEDGSDARELYSAIEAVRAARGEGKETKG